MSSNLKVNTILPSTGDTVSIAGIASITSSVSIASSCTATTFYGSGANLTGLPAQTTIVNYADNKLVTATGNATTLNAEAGLTYDGSQLVVRGSDTVTSSGGTKTVALRGGDANDEKVNLSFETGAGGPIAVISGIADATGVYPNTTGSLTFNTQVGGGVFERLRITSDGKIGINNDNPVYALHMKNAMASSPSYIHMQATGSNVNGGGGGISFDTSAANTNENLYKATIAGIRNTQGNGSNDLVFSTSDQAINGAAPTEKLRITSSGEIKQYGFTGSVDAGSDDLVIGNTDSGTNRGMTIWSHSNQNGGIAFADNDSNYRGAIQYQHAQDRFRFLAEGEEVGMWSNQRGLMVGPTNYGDSVTSKGGAKLYHLCGATPFDGSYNSSTDTPIMRCGHSFNGTMTIWMAFNGDNFHRGTRQMIYHCQGTYGYVGLHIKSQYNHNALGAGLNSLALHYQNSGSPNYYLKVTGTWASGQSDIPYLLWSWTGHNSEYPYAL